MPRPTSESGRRCTAEAPTAPRRTATRRSCLHLRQRRPCSWGRSCLVLDPVGTAPRRSGVAIALHHLAASVVLRRIRAALVLERLELVLQRQDLRFERTPATLQLA